jgi:ribosomal-protein-serine acetyltransferase
MTGNNQQNKAYDRIVVDDRITLAVLAESEADELYNLVDRNRQYLSEYLPWAITNKLEDSRVFIQKVRRDRVAETDYGFGVYVDGALAGHVSLMHLSSQQTPEIGYWIGEEWKGQGITTKVAEKITRLAMADLGIDTIIIKAATTNAASNKIAQKLGYEQFSVEQDDEGRKINVWRKTE